MIIKERNESLKDLYNIKNYPQKAINHFLYTKYSNFENSYQNICINNLLYLSYCHDVAKFKDYLIFDDNTEFLNEFCHKEDLNSRMKYIFNFYSNYIRLFPNYLVIPEKKFIYKNIRKKQKIIDEKNAKIIENKKNKNNNLVDISSFKKNKWNDYNNLNKNICFDKSSINSSINKFNLFNEADYSINIKSYSMIKIYNSNTSHKSSNNENSSDLGKINLKNYLNTVNNNNNITNTQCSSILNINNEEEESKKSKASITELINLLNSTDKQYTSNNNDLIDKKAKEEQNNKKLKFTKNCKNKIKFFRLGNSDFIKKQFKTHKIQLNFIKGETDKASLKKEHIIKKKYLKNYEQKTHIKVIDKNQVFHRQAMSFLEDISKILKNKSQNKRDKIHILKRKNNEKIKKNANECYKFVANKNLYNLSSKHKFNNIKSNISKMTSKRKYNSKVKNYNNLIISTNSAINPENNASNINKFNECMMRQNTDYQNINHIRKVSNYKLIKSIDALACSTVEQKSKTKTKKENNCNRIFKLESDSLLSTQVSVPKKYRHNSTCTRNILSLIKKSINCHKMNKNLHKNTLSFSKKNTSNYRTKQFDFKDRIKSYGMKPATQHFRKISNSIKDERKKQRRISKLKKNKIIFNFFNSKEFYDLRISKNFKKKLESKNYTSINQNKEKDIVNKSISILITSFNKENKHTKNYEIIKKNKNSYAKINFMKNKFNKIKIDKSLVNKEFSKNITNNKIENNYHFKQKHKKNRTANICKIMEEIENSIDKQFKKLKS